METKNTSSNQGENLSENLSENLIRLLATDHDDRDQIWESSFLLELPHANVQIANPEPQEGPDHWPYLLVETYDGSEHSQTTKSHVAFEPLINILHWLSERGIGLALNTMKPLPDYIFTYGMIWNFRERGEFISSTPADIRPEMVGAEKPTNARFEIQDGQQVWVGPPSEAFLPKYARVIIKQFLIDQGAFAPKVLMVSTDQKHYDLCFSIESLKSPPVHEHANIAEALAWFVPAHYAVSLLSEKTVTGFVPL